MPTPAATDDKSKPATSAAKTVLTDTSTDDKGSVDNPDVVDKDKPADNKGDEVTYTDFTVPEGMQMDTALLEKATPLFKELGLNQEQAQKLIDFQAAETAARGEVFNNLIADWQKQSQTDKEFGGDKFDASVGVAQKAIATFGNAEFKKLMEDHGIGNHPEMIRFMLNVGKTLKEDVPAPTGKTVAGKQDRVSILYPTTKE